MIKYIGNEVEWITDELLTLLETNTGSRLPVWNPNRWHGHPLLDKIRNMGETHFGNNIPNDCFTVFYTPTPGLENYKFSLPNLIPPQQEITWWFSKLSPGEYQFVHYDARLLGVIHNDLDFTNVHRTCTLINPKRYTMYLQDYEPGHVFIYEDKMSVNYKKGDIFEWSGPEILHGVANISYTNRYTLQLIMSDSEI